MKKLDHLSEVCSAYETFIIDLWGVIHNGIRLNPKAIEVIKNLNQMNKKIIFLSIASRPANEVRIFLKTLNMEDKYLKNIITSGEAAKLALNEKKFGNNFFHLGPDRDNSIFIEIKNNKTSLKKSDFILCTGLLSNQETDLKYYEKLLKQHISKKLICTNPDLTVHRGDKEEYCAGKIAQIFEKLGGEVVYFGKPYKEIYEMCFNDGKKVIAIGDNLRTDIKGANNVGIDSIFITDGVHRAEYKKFEDLSTLLNQHKVKTIYFQKELTW